MRTTLAFVLAATALNAAQSGWSVYGGDAGGTRYSALKQITRENVAKLKLAWTYHTGALQPQTALNEKAAFEATPILVEDTLYLSTPFNQVIALDPATGVARWTFDPKMDRSHGYSEVSSRGVSAWTDSRAAEGAPCKLRIFEGTIDARLIALDGKTGKPCAGFGSAGTVDLTRGVGYGPEFRGDYQVTSAPAVVGDLAITGSSIGDNGAVDMPRGVVRGYDARTGALRWTWDPIPWAEKQQVRTGAANAWSTIAADPARDLVFIPTGSASPDYFGGARPGDNRWANSVVALKASTGAFVWGFQVAHHDLWDYDVASQPALIEFQGKPAVAVTTKIGNVFVLDRATGKPLHTVEERAVPKSDVAGEEAAASQPLPAWSAMVPQRLTANDVWGATPEAREWCRQKILTLRNDGLFTPPSVRGSIAFPGNIGGVNWGSAAWDPVRNILVANTNRVAAIFKVIPREDMQSAFDHAKETETSWGGEFARQRGTPYGMHREWLVAPNAQPCNAPPWGALVAFDLNTGKLRWEAALGTIVNGWPAGSISLGGPMATAGGLIFTAAALDPHLRAFDSDTGKEIWIVELPASAQSTPMTYEWGGKQYVVICAGGHGKMKSKMGDSVVAFALE
ncbi:MAG TPA: pyrroloquinoline quinone-dependent dehydrogenase [Candidatus Acidoferrales bacterium]|nr:pyrroloquinoline quinone-dependent dehydrogenase [Candidatus Acidoferrales bacterium]